MIIDPLGCGVPEPDVGSVPRPLVELGIGDGGLGGEVRLKLWLSTVYRVNRTENWIVLRRNNHMKHANMFGLTDPAGRGTDRVREAYRWLHRNRFIKIEGDRLRPYVKIRPTHELDQFLPQGESIGLRAAPTGETEILPESLRNIRNRYVKLPRAFWESGWISYLRASEIVVLMILCDAMRSATGSAVSIPVHERTRRYGLSEEMWRQGERGLERRGLILPPSTSGKFVDDYGWGHSDAERKFQFTASSIAEALTRDLDPAVQLEIRSEIV